MKQENRQIFWLSCLAYLILLFRHGYTFGYSDHAEILPYISYLHDSSLYTKDFYVQYIQQLTPNVRWIFVHALLPFYKILPLAFFVFHAFFSLILIAGCLKIARLMQFSLYPSFFGLLAYLFLFYGKIPGGNDLYINNFQAENVAFATGIAALFLWLKRRDLWAYFLLAIGTLFHPLAGLQYFLLITLTSTFNRRLNAKAITIYLLTGGVYFLLIYFNQGHSTASDTSAYFDILFKFRQPHHSIPSHYSIPGWMLSVLCFSALTYYRRYNQDIFNIIALIAAGSIFYILGVSVFEITPVAQTQWFKTYAILYAFGSMAAGQFVTDKLKLKRYSFELPVTITALTITLFATFLFLFPDKNPLKKPFSIAGYHPDPFLMECCEFVSTSTPKDALFAVPFDCDAFNHYSQRSVYVSFKAVAHDEKGMREWYRRIGQVYGLSTKDSGGYGMTAKANKYYYAQLTAIQAGLPANFNADYALIKGHPFTENVVYENEGYQVISLKTYLHYAGIFSVSR